MTNYQWIQSMTIEEMAKVIETNALSEDLVNEGYCASVCPNIDRCPDEYFKCSFGDDASIIGWLQAERSDGDGQA